MEKEIEINKAYLFKAEHLGQITPHMGTYSDEDMLHVKGKMMSINIIGLATIYKRKDEIQEATVQIEPKTFGLANQICEMATYDNIDIAVPIGNNEYMVCHGWYQKPAYALVGDTWHINTIGPNGVWHPQNNLVEWEEEETGEMHDWIDRFY